MSYASIEDIFNEHSSYKPPSMIPNPIEQVRQPYLRQDPIYRPYPASYQPSPLRIPESHGAYVPMVGTNPIRGMVTSVYPNACSQYGSSNIHLQPIDYYGGSNWCNVGVLMSTTPQHNSIYALEARFMGNSWEFRARDAMVGLYIYLQVVGNGPYGAFRNNDVVEIPGKGGKWTIQIQTQEQPYLLYVPV